MAVARLLAILALLASGPPPLAASGVAERVRVRVIDGDTIRLGPARHRLQGIDAPETGQRCRRPGGTVWRCGAAATEALKALIGANPVTCTGSGRDRYRRHLSVCHAGGVNLNRWMVRHGWAVAYRKYVPWYIAEEDAAKRQRLGLWSGDFVMPWDWRRGKRLNR